MDEVETPIASVDHEPEPKTPIATRGRPIASPARIMKRPAAKAPTASATVKKAAKKAAAKEPTTPQATKATVATPKAPVKATQPKALAKATQPTATTLAASVKKAKKAATQALLIPQTKAKAMTRQQRLQDILVEAEDDAPLALLEKVPETAAGDMTDGAG